VYINEVLHYQFVYRKISTLTFETHHVYSEKIEKEGSDAVRRSLTSRNYKTDGVCRQQGRSTNADWQNASTQHPLSGGRQIDASRQK